MLSTSCGVKAGPHGSFAASVGITPSFAESKKNATDVTFHRINKKHFGKLVDDVRQSRESVPHHLRSALRSVQLEDRSRRRPFQSGQRPRLFLSCSRENDLHP